MGYKNCYNKELYKALWLMRVITCVRLVSLHCVIFPKLYKLQKELCAQLLNDNGLC